LERGYPSAGLRPPELILDPVDMAGLPLGHWLNNEVCQMRKFRDSV
jgi:hypothetical protein